MRLDIIIPLAFGKKRHTPLRSAIPIKQYALWQDIMLTICGPISVGGILVQVLHLPSDSPRNRPSSTQPPVVFIKVSAVAALTRGAENRRMAATHGPRARKQESRDGEKDSSQNLSSQKQRHLGDSWIVSRPAVMEIFQWKESDTSTRRWRRVTQFKDMAARCCGNYLGLSVRGSRHGRMEEHGRTLIKRIPGTMMKAGKGPLCW